MTNRKRLDNRRRSETFVLRFWNDKFHVTVGYYGGNDPGEVFVAGSKSGAQLDSVCRDGAVMLSLAMQYGIPLEVIRDALTRESNGEPSTIIGAIVDKLCAERDTVLLPPPTTNLGESE